MWVALQRRRATGSSSATRCTWIDAWDARFTFAADGIALVMLALIALLVPVVILASWHDAENSRRSIPAYFALLLALESTMLGVFAAADIFLFYVFFEVMLVPMYFLIGSYGGPRRQYAAVKFFLYSLVGGLFMLAAVIGLWVARRRTRSTGRSCVGRRLLDRRRAVAVPRLLPRVRIKAPFFPFHTWLPDAGAAAPAGAAALLVGVLDKVGTFGILRYCLPLFPNASKYFAPLGDGARARRHHLRRAARDRPERPEATGGVHLDRALRLHRYRHLRVHHPGRDRAVLYMVNHGLATGLLFLVVGMFVARRAVPWSATSAVRASSAGTRRGVLLRRYGLAGAAGHVAVRLRVPGADRHVHGQQAGGDHRDRRHHPGRRVRAVDDPAHHPGHAQPGAGAGRGA